MSWCGLQLHTRSLEVRMDTARFLATALSDAVTSELAANPGLALQEKLLNFIRPKCLILLLDGGAFRWLCLFSSSSRWH